MEELTEEALQSLLMKHTSGNAEKPVLLKFHANWCGPCKALTPIVDEFVKNHAEELDAYSVDVDKHTEFVAELKIRSVPYIVVLHKGQTIHLCSGLLSKEELESKYTEYVTKQEKCNEQNCCCSEE